MPQKDKPMLSPLMPRAPAANFAEMSARVGVPTVAASWPTGLAHLGLLVSTCERCDTSEVCSDWLARVPQRVAAVPPFCRNADGLRAAKAPG